MKITASFIDKLIRLRDGEKLPMSQLRGEWVEELLRDGILVCVSHGSRKAIFSPDSGALCKALAIVDERLGNLEIMRATVSSEDTNRSDQASETGNSKLVAVRSCPGFPVNSYESIGCSLNGEEFIVNPREGSFLFIADWKTFTIPSDVVVVGIENMENFRLIRRQRNLFNQAIGGKRLLFVSRYPQSADLRGWLCGIPNRYVHFGDFDLAGINIFLTEFHAHLGSRSSFLVPADIERRLSSGSLERYNVQYHRFKKVSSNIPEVQQLINLINKHHRCYDQEGYI